MTLRCWIAFLSACLLCSACSTPGQGDDGEETDGSSSILESLLAQHKRISEPGPPPCSAFRLPDSDHPGPVVKDLQGALGLERDSEEVDAILDALGPGVEREGPVAELLVFARSGVELGFDSDDRLVLVRLLGRHDSVQPYVQPLPFDLHYAMERDEVAQAMSTIDTTGCLTIDACLNHVLGVTYEYSGQCLATVNLTTPLPDNESIIHTVSSAPEERRSRASGFLVQVGQLVANKHLRRPIKLTAQLISTEGRPVKVLQQQDHYADRRGRLAVTSEHSSSDHLVTHAIFVPYAAVDLPQGPGQLKVELSAWVAPDPENVDRWSKLGLLGTSDELLVAYNMPEVREVKLNIEEVEVEPGQYDSNAGAEFGAAMAAIFTLGLVNRSPSKANLRPDLQWTVGYGPHGHFRSQVRKNSYSGRWAQKTPWIRVADGDELTIRVVDQDTTFHDKLATYIVTLDGLEELVGAPLTSGKVKSLTISEPIVR